MTKKIQYARIVELESLNRTKEHLKDSKFLSLFQTEENKNDLDFSNKKKTYGLEQTSILSEGMCDQLAYLEEKGKGRNPKSTKAMTVKNIEGEEIFAFLGFGHESLYREIMKRIKEKEESVIKKMVLFPTYCKVDLLLTIPYLTEDFEKVFERVKKVFETRETIFDFIYIDTISEIKTIPCNKRNVE